MNRGDPDPRGNDQVKRETCGPVKSGHHRLGHHPSRSLPGGKAGCFLPLLKKLQAHGVRRQNILIIVGTGTHRASTPQEKVEMLGKEIASVYTIQDHDCEDRSSLVYVGKTPDGDRSFFE